NPFLWYVIPGPRAFDVRPVEYDLTPFAGQLNDGKPHRISVTVAGVPEGQSGWDAPVNVLVWQDAKASVVTGAVTRHEEGTPRNTADYQKSDRHKVTAGAAHALTVSGYLKTSHGRVTTTVTRRLAATSLHRWKDGEATDGLRARWTDDETVTV